MEERYKELIMQLYRQVEAKFDRIASVFYHYFGKDKVDLQYNTDVETAYNNLLSGYLVDSIFRSLLPREKEHCIYENLEEGDKLTVNAVLAGIVGGERDRVYGDIFHNIIDALNIRYVTILVHFPEVRVTNENDKYTDIQDLYAEIGITYEGKMRSNFTLNRTTYTVKQLMSNYLHSHVDGIGTSLGELRTFKTPCLGSGPIRETCNQLAIHECGNVEWELFCVELDRYVHTESKIGVPYKYLENIGARNSRNTDIDIVHVNYCHVGRILEYQDIRKFIERIIDSKRLKFNYINGSYSLGMSVLQYIVMVSNMFIEWYNDSVKNHEQVPIKERLFARSILIRVTVVNGRIYEEDNNSSIEAYKGLVGETILKFKGRDVPFRIIDFKEEQQNGLVILNPKIAISMLSIILQVLNYRYGKEKASGGPVLGENRYTSTIETDAIYI